MNTMCKNACWVFLSIFLCLNSTFAADGIESSIAEISDKILKNKDRVSQGSFVIGVTSFRHSDNSCSGLGNSYSELLTESLMNSELNAEFIDRITLDRLQRELEFNRSPDVDIDTAREFGKKYGAGALMLGTLTADDNNVRVMVKLVDTETSRIIITASSSFPNTPEVNSQLKNKSQSICPDYNRSTGMANTDPLANDLETRPVSETYEMKAVIKSIKYSKTKKVIEAVVDFYNKLDTNLFVSLNEKLGYIAGEKGEKILLDDLKGMKVCKEGNIQYCVEDQNEMYRIAPKSRLRSNFFFKSKKKWDFASSLVLYMYTRDYRETKDEWNNIEATIDFIDIKIEE
ncbi:MAG: FlgO family outer membrane protein [Candidatus Electrothrix sp. Rat3]|nr:FlgO family outer membrane protein [Candidatus Electrothrix rattekaaiensis]